MNKKYFLWILLVTLLGIATACTTTYAVNDVSQKPDVSKIGVENEIVQPDSTDVADSVLETLFFDAALVESPTNEPNETVDFLPTDSPVIEGQEDHQCEDPFAGGNIRFSDAGWDTNFCLHSVPYDEFLSGGPPRDGIPPIDAPVFIAVETAYEWLEDQEPVISLVINGKPRAYPLQILIWHEIVNDTLGEVPVVVTFCPLCNTALVFVRPNIDGDLLTFGTSGNLRNSDLVMWDRQTESWWQQFTGEAIVGDLTGTQLEFLPTAILSWGDFKTKYTEGEVLSRDTGVARNYGSNPYAGYDNINQFPFLFDGPLDDRILPMTRVLGVTYQESSVAYVYDRLFKDLVINDSLGENSIVAFWKAGTASAVDASSIPDGRDVGTTGVFLSAVGDQKLTFTSLNDGTFRDDETGSTWDILGEAIAGPLEGTFLTSVPHHDTFWFAWAAFTPDSNLAD